MLNIKNDIVIVFVAVIILGSAIPSGGLLRDYTTEYCNKDFSYQNGDGPDYPFYLNKDIGFFSCEIGYIEGHGELEYYLNFPSQFEKEVFILDYSNYNDYLNGEVFGVNNFDLIVEKNEYMVHDDKKGAYFLPSNYFFVIDWDYRTSYESEEVVRPYFIDHAAPVDICHTSLNWEDSNCIIFNYYLDFDYYAEDDGK